MNSEAELEMLLNQANRTSKLNVIYTNEQKIAKKRHPKGKCQYRRELTATIIYEYDIVTVKQLGKSNRETAIDVHTTTGDNRMCAVISQTLAHVFHY
jgi:hypothetical protein